MRTVRLATFLFLWFAQAACAQERIIQFTDNPSAPAFRAALQALRANNDGANVRLSEVSAAFVTLVDGKPPQLLVYLTGGFCGSAGCAVTLYEQGVQGWIRSNQWQVGSIGVLPEKAGAGWHNLMLNHEVVWSHIGMEYVAAQKMVLPGRRSVP